MTACVRRLRRSQFATSHVIQSWNLAAERIFGYTAEETIGRSIRMIIPADRQAEEDMVLGHIRAGEAITHFETIRQRKDGTQIPISLTVSPIYNDDGGAIRAAAVELRSNGFAIG